MLAIPREEMSGLDRNSIRFPKSYLADAGSSAWNLSGSSSSADNILPISGKRKMRLGSHQASNSSPGQVREQRAEVDRVLLPDSIRSGNRHILRSPRPISRDATKQNLVPRLRPVRETFARD